MDSNTLVDQQMNAGNISDKTCQAATSLSSNRGFTGYTPAKNMIDAGGLETDYLGTRGLPYIYRHSEEAREANASSTAVPTADIREEMAVEETGMPLMYFRNNTSFRNKVPVMQPVSHRIVWLRLPRFAGKLEMEDINSNNIRITPFLNESQTKAWIDSLGTAVKGNACWKVLRPECSPSGGTVTSLRVKSDTALVSGSAGDEL